ncbi:MAG TPA: phage tail protein [Pyrinomonadaceae bacterium]|jgi:phage tail-like protein|nr:phage tail protein [Pyrinomonadaceae bacterium]
MTKSANETVVYPFVAFNFSVEIRVDGVAMQICDAAFAECDGLEITMEVKTIREGGNNGKQIRLTGPLNFGSVTLRRGMTETFDLWRWVNLMLTNPETRADAEVVVFAPDGTTESARFILSRCVPVKLKAPPLNAKDGAVAIEELQLAYESLSLKDNTGTSGQ